jgi:hypothetical protein
MRSPSGGRRLIDAPDPDAVHTPPGVARSAPGILACMIARRGRPREAQLSGPRGRGRLTERLLTLIVDLVDIDGEVTHARCEVPGARHVHDVRPAPAAARRVTHGDGLGGRQNEPRWLGPSLPNKANAPSHAAGPAVPGSVPGDTVRATIGGRDEPSAGRACLGDVRRGGNPQAGRVRGHVRGQHARLDILASDLADTRRISIQVKTKSSGSWHARFPKDATECSEDPAETSF